MKKHILSFIAVVGILLLTSCVNTKQVTYFQNIDSISLAASRGIYEAHIRPSDELAITVHTSDPIAARPFNLAMSQIINKDEMMGSNSQQGILSYQVDKDGNINFPVVGTVHVAGLTRSECQNLIKQKVKPYLAATEEPVVTVRLSSYRVTVTGEVGAPGVYPVTSEKMSLLEALASAGDLTIYGKRDNVLLVREDEAGEKHQYRINLNDANLINSPLYYVQQNDYIYVEPNKSKARTADISQSTTIWFSIISTVTSIVTLIVSLTR